MQKKKPTPSRHVPKQHATAEQPPVAEQPAQEMPEAPVKGIKPMSVENPNNTVQLNDSETNNSTTATVTLYDDEGQQITVEKPETITWATSPADALKLTPQKDGSVEIETVKGRQGTFPVVGTDPKSGKSGTGRVIVSSPKPQSEVTFGGVITKQTKPE